MDGTCHCGAARWRFEGTGEAATSCNCSVCRRHGALWAYGFEGEAFTLSGETATYVWNRRWLAFHFCARCACVVAWRATDPGEDGRRYGAVNLRLAVDPDDVAAVPIVRHDTVTGRNLPRDGRRVADVWA
ncbi:MAG: GFA family protein [Proteobacteria bacterium]|nr:GFA family protein [Pseudomonadota bacterium]